MAVRMRLTSLRAVTHELMVIGFVEKEGSLLELVPVLIVNVLFDLLIDDLKLQDLALSSLGILA